MGHGGGKLDDQDQSVLEQEILDRLDCAPHPVCPGKLDGERIWMDAVLGALPGEWGLHGVKVVLDAAHGAAWRVGPKLLRHLGAEVVEIGTKPDGRNINQGVGALHPETLGARVLEESAAVGIGLDGDADRCVLVDSTGSVVDGDGLMLLLAEPPGLVGTVMCNAALEDDRKNGHIIKCLIIRCTKSKNVPPTACRTRAPAKTDLWLISLYAPWNGLATRSSSSRPTTSPPSKL